MTDKPVYSPEQMAREVEAVAAYSERNAAESKRIDLKEAFMRRAAILRAAAKLLRGEPQIGVDQ